MQPKSFPKDPIIDYFRQRLIQMYGQNLYAALLIGARARGVRGHGEPYDIALFLRRMRDQLVELEQAEMLQSEMMETFAVRLNVYPFSAIDFNQEDGAMQAVRSVGLPIMPLPPEAQPRKQLNSRAEYVLDKKDILCLKTVRQPSDCDLATYEVYAASVRTGTTKQWSILLPYTEDRPDELYMDDNYGSSRFDTHSDNTFDDPCLVDSALKFFKSVQENRLVSVDPDVASAFLFKAMDAYRSHLRNASVELSGRRVGSYRSYVVDIANATRIELPEVALCKAEFNAAKRTPDLPPACKAVRHEAEVLRQLLEIV